MKQTRQELRADASEAEYRDVYASAWGKEVRPDEYTYDESMEDYHAWLDEGREEAERDYAEDYDYQYDYEYDFPEFYEPEPTDDESFAARMRARRMAS